MLNKSGLHFFKEEVCFFLFCFVFFGLKKKASMYTESQYGLGSWEGGLTITEGAPALAFQEEGHLIFIFNMDILYFWSICPFL